MGWEDEVERVNSYWVTVKKLFTLLNIIEGTLDRTRRRGRTRKQPLGDGKEIIYAIKHY